MRVRVLPLLAVLASCGGDESSGPPVPNALRFTAISAGYYHTCGLASSGRAYCWGTNDFGTLGDGTRTGRTVPTAVAGGLAYTTIDAGAGHNCALAPNGIAECWGLNDEGQLGDGSFVPRDRPVGVTGSLSFRAVSAGHAHSCGITSNGVAYCWGDNTRGQLGAGTETPTKSATPLRVLTTVTFDQIIAGYYQTCALTVAGEAYCWGLNSSGQNGDNSTTDRHSPVRAQTGRTFTWLSAGDRFVCGISDGRTLCWGANRHGESRNGELMTKVFAAAGESTLAAESYACGIRNDSRAFCWGGAIRGLRAASSDLQPLHSSLSVSAIGAGSQHVCATDDAGYAYCGGANYAGQLGDGTRADRSSLLPVSGPVTP